MCRRSVTISGEICNSWNSLFFVNAILYSRKDYGGLHVLKTSFPKVPILALTATCPPSVLKDLVKQLRLKSLTPGECQLHAALSSMIAHDPLGANYDGTVYFSAPLYRKNLHYQVLPKPSKGEATYQAIVDWITANHLGESGIVYCYSKAVSPNPQLDALDPQYHAGH